MRIQYLGTAAAEGWPALFCRCESCERARSLGGKNIRTRSQSIIDDELVIDMPADTYLHALKYNIDFSDIHDILITHSHEDHFYPLDIILKAPPYAYNGGAKNINVYGNDVIIKRLREAMDLSGIPTIYDYIAPIQVEAFIPFNAGEYRITALLADHIPDENCYIYDIEKDRKRLLYAHDTGVFPEDTWRYLSGNRFDLISLDCTFVMRSNEKGHLGLPNVYEIKQKMMRMGCADSNTKFVINHFSHNGNKTHDELADSAEKLGILTAYDGLTVEF